MNDDLPPELQLRHVTKQTLEQDAEVPEDRGEKDAFIYGDFYDESLLMSPDELIVWLEDQVCLYKNQYKAAWALAQYMMERRNEYERMLDQALGALVELKPAPWWWRFKRKGKK